MKQMRERKRDPLEFLKTQQMYGRRSHIVATLLVLFACLGASALAWLDASRNAEDAFKKAAETRIEETNQTVGNRLILASTILSGGAGLFRASEQVTRSEWDAFITSVYQKNLFPGIEAFGYASYVRPGELDAHVATMQQISTPNYSVAPITGDTTVHVPVNFIAPSSPKREQVIGYNMYANDTRRKAIDTARDSGMLSVSGKLDLITDKQGTSNRRGVVMFAPVYRNGAPIDTLEQRQQNFIGVTYAVAVIDDMFNGVFGAEDSQDVAIEIYDNNKKSEDNFLYRSKNFDVIKNSRKNFIVERPTTITDHQWLITHAVGYNTLSQAERDAPLSSLLRGLIISIALAFFVYYLLTHRTRKILESKHREVQSAKDDLLSLASHQLRTPATVVKQYVGMLLQGYGGEMSEQQKSMLESAYASNERQLQIINQILYVARLDAGQIKLHKERMSLNKLLKDVVGEHVNSFKESKQKLSLRVPKNTIYIRADKQYLHMVLDNLLSNASKYTPDGGRVSVGLTKIDKQAKIYVKDNGVGITNDELDAIFDKFTRGSSEITSQVSGSGIGLYLVKRITELHKGTIQAKPNRPHGTVFELRLPLGATKRLKAKKK